MLGQLKSGGLASVDIPVLVENGEIKGWYLVTEPTESNKVITRRNLQHLHQATPTPLGHGEGYKLFHIKERHKTANNVLAGELKWKHPVEEVNVYIKNSKKSSNEEVLKE